MSTTTAGPAHHVPVYRLTRRGRVVLLVVAFLALVALGFVFAGGSVATNEPQATQTVVVAPGDTLWSIAAGASESDDVREMMQYLVELNDLDDAALAAGQQLEVPVG